MSYIKLFLFIVGTVSSVRNAVAEEPDWSSYRAVLQYVKAGQKHGVSLMLVDYPLINSNGSLDKIYRELASF
ncbi:MAG: hypothetical protein ACU837_07585 [Gammaproteobacteria bacterium]